MWWRTEARRSFSCFVMISSTLEEFLDLIGAEGVLPYISIFILTAVACVGKLWRFTLPKPPLSASPLSKICCYSLMCYIFRLALFERVSSPCGSFEWKTWFILKVASTSSSMIHSADAFLLTAFDSAFLIRLILYWSLAFIRT